MSPWPPDALNYLAQEKGFFKKNGVNVELLWSDGYENTFGLVESGDLDVWNMTLLDAVAYNANEGIGQIMLLQDFSEGADAIVTLSNKEIESVSQLVGKKVGVEKGTVGEFFLKLLLEKEGLILSDVNIIDMASEDILKGLQNESIEVGVCYEPCPINTLKAGGKIIVDSAREKNLIADAYVANEDDLKERKADYINIAKSIVEAGDYYRKHPDESAEIMQKPLNMPKEEIISTFNGLHIPTLEENYQAFDVTSGSSALGELVKSAVQYLEQQEIIKKSIKVNDILNPTIVEGLL